MRLKIFSGNDWHNSSNWFFPITDKLAPKSTMPDEPWDAKRIGSSGFSILVSSWIRGSTIWFGLVSRLSLVVGLIRERNRWTMGCQLVWNISLLPLCLRNRLWVLKAECNKAFRNECTCGWETLLAWTVKATAWSGGSWSSSFSNTSGSAMVIPAKAAGRFPEALPDGFDWSRIGFCGHSAFQCPRCPQMRHEEFMILWASGCRNLWPNDPFGLPFPLWPLDRRPFQKPLLFVFSNKRCRAST